MTCDSTNFPCSLQKRWNQIAGAANDWWWIVDLLLDSQNKGQQFSLENRQIIAKEIRGGMLRRESDVNGILKLSGLDLR